MKKFEADMKGTEHSFRRSVPRKVGQRKAVLYGYSSFRTTWVTTALLAGIPISLVRRVMGHVSDDMIEKYYFQAAEDQAIAAVNKALLPLLGLGGVDSPTGESRAESPLLESFLDDLDAMNDKNWRSMRNLLRLSIKSHFDSNSGRAAG